LDHLKNPNKLGGINASDLLVYKNKAAFDARNNAKDDGKEQVLDPTESIGMLGSKEDMLLVAVPDLSLIKEPSRKRKQQSNEHNKILDRNLKMVAKAMEDSQTPSFCPCKLPFFNSIGDVTERKGWISFG
jgi:hypothetical protein